jgi:ArsR family transcriptional regulator
MSKKSEFNAEKLFLALSDRTRLRLLNLMRDGEVCVCFFTEVLQAPQPTISRHLAYLRRAGVVSARREGKWMHYRIADPPDPRAARVFHEICAWIGEESEMRHDCERLVKVCCSPRMPLALRGAPRPAGIVNIEKRAMAPK